MASSRANSQPTRRPRQAPASSTPRKPRPAAARSTGSRRPPATRTRRPAKPKRKSARWFRPLLVALLLLFLVAGVAGSLRLLGGVDKAVTEITLPLKHEDIIRQQSAKKGLDPALVAAVIFAESHFRDGQVSSAGAVGLMQLTPDTARDVARQSGGSAFVLADLETPQVNISYGTWRLRHMLQRFNNRALLAVAAYNAGPENVQKWVNEAAAAGKTVTVSSIPFAETRNYVRKVLDARRDYRRTYSVELGLN